jgi:hypothetical protein
LVFGLIKQEPVTHRQVPSVLVDHFEMLISCWDSDPVLKHKPFNLASKNKRFSFLLNGAIMQKKQKLSIEK